MAFTRANLGGDTGGGTVTTVAVGTSASGQSSGDLSVAIVAVDAASPPAAISSLGNWTQILFDTSQSLVNVWIGFIRDSGAATENLVFTADVRGTWTTVHITAGHHTTTAPEATAANGSSAAPDCPSEEHSAGSGDYLGIAVVADGDGTNTTIDDVTSTTTDNDYTAQNVSVGSVGTSVRASDLELSSVSSWNPAAGTLSGSVAWVAATILVPAAAGGGGGAPLFVHHLNQMRA